MSVVTIPTRQDRPHYEMQVTLDGATYTLELRWAAREAAWFLSIRGAADEEIATGIKVVLGIPLAARNAKRTPPGTLIAHDTSGQQLEARIDDLGTRVQLLYFEESEGSVFGG